MHKKDVLNMTEDENNELLCNLILSSFQSDFIKHPVTEETLQQVKYFLDEFLYSIESTVYMEKNEKEKTAYLEMVIEKVLENEKNMTGDNYE